MISANNKLRRQRHGSVLPLVLMIIVILLMTGNGLLSLGMHSRMLAARTTAQIKARSAADAGLTKAMFQMNQQLKTEALDEAYLPKVTAENVLSSNTSFDYEVTKNLDGTYQVTVIGHCGQTQKNVTGILVLDVDESSFPAGILVNNQVYLDNTAFVDAYNSDDGVYGLPNAHKKTSIATNSSDPTDVFIKHAATFYGRVELDANAEMEEVSAPSGAEFLVTKGDITSSTTISSSGTYTNILVGNKDKITIDGNITLYVTDNIEILNLSEIIILPDSSLTLYVGGNLTIRNSSVVNEASQKSSQCIIYGTGEDATFTFDNQATLYSSIYAPKASVDLNNQSILYGAIVADNTSIANSSQLHYDAALMENDVGDYDIGGFGDAFVIQFWQEN